MNSLSNFSFSDPYALLAILIGISLAPFIALMVTSYVKLVIVFNIIRTSLGVQQIPPNTVVNGLAIILTIYIMNPVFIDTFKAFSKHDFSKLSAEQTFTTALEAANPLKEFLLNHTKEHDRDYFLKSAQRLWGEEKSAQAKADDFIILVPAFMVNEMTTGFKIGFLIYLPFTIIDLIVSNVLLAMGMMMVSPMTISMPFKLLLFVIVNGWSKLIQGLLMTY